MVSPSQIYKDPNDRNNPYAGINWSVEDLLTAFSHEVQTSTSLNVRGDSLLPQELNDVCLGHLFTYRDFKGMPG